ncbi:hypothetical protein LR69_04603 [Geobacillus sp. BCO2]|nr:hypothetical protein LR69_04603 [Geobacillus sp. BCO2]
MKMFSRQNVFFAWQDLRLHRTVIKMILGVMSLLMLAGVLPLGMMAIGKWHSLKDFILLYRYEFFHLPVFLFSFRFNTSNERVGDFKKIPHSETNRVA